MSPFVPPEESIVHESQYWRLNCRLGTDYPGYLVISPIDATCSDLAALPLAALQEMGAVIAEAVAVVEDLLHPTYVHICRFGHTPGHAFHFHLIPVFDWACRAYLEHSSRSDANPNGPQMTEFILNWLIYNLSTLGMTIPQRDETIRSLRKRFSGGANIGNGV